MKDLTNLTNTEANKIEMVLVMMCRSFQQHIDAEIRLSKSDDLTEEQRKLFADNAEWSKEAYKLIYGEDYSSPEESEDTQ